MVGQGSPEPAAAELDAVLDGLDRFALSLVRVEPHALEEVRRFVDQFSALVERHLAEASRPEPRPRAAARPAPELLARIAAEHERFYASVEQLRGLLRVVEEDDHGGHRQALGQYARLLVEALRSHRADERLLAARLGAEAPTAALSRRPGKP